MENVWKTYGQKKNRYGFWQNTWQKRMVKNHTFETYGEAIHFIREPYGQKRVVWAKMYGLKRMAQKQISIILYMSHMARNRMV